MKQADPDNTPAPGILKLASAYGRLCAKQDHEAEAQTKDDSELLTLIAMHRSHVSLYHDAWAKKSDEVAEKLYGLISAIELEIQETPARTIGGAIAKIGVFEAWLGKDLTVERLQLECFSADIALSVIADLSRLAPRVAMPDA